MWPRRQLTIDQHLDRLAVVFEKLQGAGLKLKPKKCKLLHDSIKYLGMIIDKEGCRPDPESVEVVRTWKAPKDLRTLRSFLGFVNYYREFIEDYATRIQPLQILVRNKGDWVWEEKHQECFEAMKETLIKAPVLGLPQEEGLFILDTDASLVAIAAVLSQQQMKQGRLVEVPIAYASKVLSPTEQRYGAAKLEMYAAKLEMYAAKLEMYADKEFIQKFEPFLVRAPFLLRVDNSALSWLRKYSMTNALCARWIQQLEHYLFRRGKSTGMRILSRREHKILKTWRSKS